MTDSENKLGFGLPERIDPNQRYLETYIVIKSQKQEITGKVSEINGDLGYLCPFVNCRWNEEDKLEYFLDENPIAYRFNFRDVEIKPTTLERALKEIEMINKKNNPKKIIYEKGRLKL